MLLGWHYMDYYSNAYAVNQYLAAHGFVVLSVNYRLGIGYGRAFHQPEHARLSPAHPNIRTSSPVRAICNPSPASIPPASVYGAALTAATSPPWAFPAIQIIFKAGVDLHGVHDWSALLDDVLSQTGGPLRKRRSRGGDDVWPGPPPPMRPSMAGHRRCC